MKFFILKVILIITTFISAFVVANTSNVSTEVKPKKDEKSIVEVQEEIITDPEQKSDQKELQTEQEKVEEKNKENTSSTSTTSTTKNNSNNNSTNNNVSNAIVKEEIKQENITESKKEESVPIQNNNSNNQNKSCGIYQSITNCKWDYDTSSACYNAGDHLTELYLNDWMDYNDANPDNPKARDIQNTECYSVDTEQGTKWYLLVVCYSGTCRENYKYNYLGK